MNKINLFCAFPSQDLRESKRLMIERGRDFLEQHKYARDKIARLCDPFIMDDMTILTHSR